MFFLKNINKKKINNSEVKIISAYDFRYSKIGKLSEKNIKKYANYNNFDFEIFKIKHFYERPAAWFKIDILKKLILNEKYKYFLWIDSDAFFCNYENILDSINKDKNFHIVFHHIESRLKNKNKFLSNFYFGPNMGFFLIKNCEWSFKLLNDIWSKKRYINADFWEQSAFFSILGINTEIGSRKKNLYNRKIMSKIEILDLKWNSVPNREFFLKKKQNTSLFAFQPNIIHLAGMRRKYRVKFLKKYNKYFL
ncbi:galactosyl transferase GMA12/MNN10 family [alpha proteobacterium HIMB114]|nr:galactosyl transferase GMA12/MNN10 family [alpha proteobacterium HIMB114]